MARWTPAFVCLLSLVCGRALAVNGEGNQITMPASHPSRVMVRFRPGATPEQIVVAKQQAGVIAQLREYPVVPGLVCLEVQPGGVDDAIASLNSESCVQYAEHDFVRSVAAQEVPYGITMVKSPECWAAGGNTPIARGNAATVAILDTGIDLTHPDLTPPVLTTSFVVGEPVNDLHTHGTHCAGIVSAIDNTDGVIGVAPSVHIMAGKVLSNSGWGYDSDVEAGVSWAATNGASVVSMSLGGGDFAQSFADTVTAVIGMNVTVIAAAGNNNSSGPFYPAWYPGVISVAAVDSNMARASFSNFGPGISVSAPGVNVRSTIPQITTTATWNNTAHSSGTLSGSAIANVSGTIYFCDIGDTPDDFPAAVSGNIAHIRRGTVSFQQKVDNAVAAGAIGVIISNNNGGVFGGTLGNGSSIPVVAISQTDGDQLQNTFNGTPGQITIAMTGHTYANYSGTSMACPHVAGVAGLLYSTFGTSSVTPALVRQAMEQSALDLGDAGRDDLFGYGLVNAQAARALLASLIPACDPIDFNRDSLFPDTQDIDDFLTVFSGGTCSNAPNCGDIDFNNDGLFPDTTDIDALLSVFSGGPCI